MIIVGTSWKGGIGNTVTNVNLAYWLSYTRGPTILMDYDGQGDCAKHLKLEGGNQAAKFLSRTLSAGDALVDTIYPDLSLMPSNRRIGKAEQNIATLIDQEDTEEERNEIRKIYADMIRDAPAGGYGVVDAPKMVSEIQKIAVKAADLLIIPTRIDAGSRINALAFAMAADALMAPNARMVMLPVSLDGRQRASNEEMIDYLRTECARIVTGRPVAVDQGIPQSVIVTESIEAGVPLLGYAPLSPPAIAYNRFFTQILGA
jgi:cellulose biosynthesis protein BcsQ